MTKNILTREYGDNYIHFPEDVMRDCGWIIGTVLEYEEETDGSVILHRWKNEIQSDNVDFISSMQYN